MKIQAHAASAAGQPLHPWTYESPAPGAYECVVEISHCGICHSDIHVIDNDWAMSLYPLVPGHEIVGVVIEAGPQSVVKTGTRVGIGWQKSACLNCDDCVSGRENMCDHLEATIIGNHGGFASHVITDSRFAFPLPDGVDSVGAGPLLCGGITVYSALVAAGMRPGSRVGVIGVGGLGHMAVLFASKLGCPVTVFTSSPDKAEMAGRLGASEAILSTPDGPEKNPSRPLDIIISTAPASIPIVPYLNILGSDGTLTFVGVSTEPLVVPVFPLLVKRRRIMSSPIGGRNTIREMLNLADHHGIQPIVETYPLSDANRALDAVRKNTVRYRAVLTNN